jgi:hypothetical protein
MKLRCCCCHGQLGLGFKSKSLWESNEWGYRRYRFCGTRCIDLFMQMRQAVDGRTPNSVVEEARA